jgi:hypothetical protein
MPLAKATITVLDDAAVDEERGLPKQFTVQFNPTKYTIQKSAQIAEVAIPGLDTPILQFVRGQNEKLTLDLFFDTTRGDKVHNDNEKLIVNEVRMGGDAKDVRDLTTPFYQLVKTQPKTHAPPRIRFAWGGLEFKAIVESIQQEFLLFNPQGVPLRAKLSVTFREYKTVEDQVAEFKWESPDYSKRYVVQEGETLNRIAAAEYGDPALWRTIAAHNRICNPRRLTPGMQLLLPPLDPSGQPVFADDDPFVTYQRGSAF